MSRTPEHPAPSQRSTAGFSAPEPHADDRWLADLSNDLGALSLSSENRPVHHAAEMEFEEDPRVPRPRHFQIGC